MQEFADSVRRVLKEQAVVDEHLNALDGLIAQRNVLVAAMRTHPCMDGALRMASPPLGVLTLFSCHSRDGANNAVVELLIAQYDRDISAVLSAIGACVDKPWRSAVARIRAFAEQCFDIIGSSEDCSGDECAKLRRLDGVDCPFPLMDILHAAEVVGGAVDVALTNFEEELFRARKCLLAHDTSAEAATRLLAMFKNEVDLRCKLHKLHPLLQVVVPAQRPKK